MNNIPKVFSEYITNIEPKPVNFMEVKHPKYSLTQDEARQDFEMFCYLIENAYSGKEYWEKQGISFAERYKRVTDKIGKSENVDYFEFFNNLCEVFEDVHDGHLFVSSALTGKMYFHKTYKAYFSDVLLERQDNGYIVIKSKNDEVQIGDKINNATDKEMFFPTLSPAGKQHFLLGIRSWTPVDTLDIAVNEELRTILLHECRKSKDNKSGIFEYCSIGDHAIVKSSSFQLSDNEDFESLKHDFEDLGKALRDKPHVIWDIHDNCGGSSLYPEAFVRGLNVNAEWFMDGAVLSSPAIGQRRGTENFSTERKWDLYESNKKIDKISTYKGTLYILIGEKVISAGEGAISQAMNVNDCVLIGSNTGGVCTFGDTITYELPVSRILLCLAHKMFLGGAKEGEGYAPHFWLDSNNVLQETLKWLDNPITYAAI